MRRGASGGFLFSREKEPKRALTAGKLRFPAEHVVGLIHNMHAVGADLRVRPSPAPAAPLGMLNPLPPRPPIPKGRTRRGRRPRRPIPRARRTFGDTVPLPGLPQLGDSPFKTCPPPGRTHRFAPTEASQISNSSFAFSTAATVFASSISPVRHRWTISSKGTRSTCKNSSGSKCWLCIVSPRARNRYSVSP